MPYCTQVFPKPGYSAHPLQKSGRVFTEVEKTCYELPQVIWITDGRPTKCSDCEVRG